MVEMIEKGKELINAKKYDEAIEVFEAINNNRRGYPDAYYFLAIIYYFLGNLQKSREHFDLALKLLHVMSSIDGTYDAKFRQWLKEYKSVFGDDFLMPVAKENRACENKIAKIMKKSFKKALSEWKRCKPPLSVKLMQMKFEMLSAFKSREVLGLLGYIATLKDKKVLLAIGDQLYKQEFYYLSGFIYDYLVENYDDWYLPYARVAAAVKKINGKISLAIQYTKDAIERDKENVHLHFDLLRLYMEVGNQEAAQEILMYVKKNFKEVDVCEELIDIFSSFDIYESGCEAVLEKINTKEITRKMAQLYLQIFYFDEKNAKKNLDEIKQRLRYTSIVNITDAGLKKKIESLENSITFFTIGRGGSFFFHSLIDGHKEVATIPGVYFKGYFSSGVFNSCSSTTAEEFVDKFMSIYEVVFDASSKKPVPGNPMDGLGQTTVAEASGLTNLGNERDIAIKVDKEAFKEKLVVYLKQTKNVDEKTFFQLIHVVWEEVVRGDDFSSKKALFYHIHNANLSEYIAYKRYFKSGKNIFMIRNWLQSLESWMHGSIIYFKNKSLDYDARLLLFKKYHKDANGKIIHRLHSLRAPIFVDDVVAFVKLEDVKNTPEATMRAVAKWMGIGYDESLLEASFMGLKFHSNKSKLNPTISEFDKKAIKRKVGVLFSDKDAVLLNTVLKPWNETFGYGAGEFAYVSVEEALEMNEEIMDWEQKLIDFYEIKTEDALESIKYRKQKLALALKHQEQVFEELKKVELIKPEGIHE